MPMQIHVDSLITDSGENLSTDSISNAKVKLSELADVQISNLETGNMLIWNAPAQKWVNYGQMGLSLFACYAAGLDGIQTIDWGGQSREMNVSFYNGKAWAEILVSVDSSVSAPWDRGWINENNYLVSANTVGEEIKKINYDGFSQAQAAESSGLSADHLKSSVLVTTEILTSVLFTAKTSYDAGTNSSAVLSLAHLTAANRALFTDYFNGSGGPFELADSFGWAGGPGIYDSHISYRNGQVRGGEWMIQDSITGSSTGTPRWGYRKSGTDNNGAKAAGLDIEWTNCLSCWACNY
jgi:hypothetical protein